MFDTFLPDLPPTRVIQPVAAGNSGARGETVMLLQDSSENSSLS